MVVAMADVSREAVRGMSRTTESYAPKKRVRVPAWMCSEEVPS
jgi:hypothetical protein